MRMTLQPADRRGETPASLRARAMAPEKPGQMLLRAFLVLREPNGLTVPQIVKFYRRTHDVPVGRASLLVQRALRQAEEQGFVARVRNRFVLGLADAVPSGVVPEVVQSGGGGGAFGPGGGMGGGPVESSRKRYGQRRGGFRESRKRRGKRSGSRKRKRSRKRRRR